MPCSLAGLLAAVALSILLYTEVVACQDNKPAAWRVPSGLASSVNGAAGLVKRGLLAKESLPMVCASCMMSSTYCTKSLCSDRAGVSCALYACNWPVQMENGTDASPKFCTGVYYNEDGRVMVGCSPPADAADACPKEWAPVCGSDNTTYPNSCLASQAGVETHQAGVCSAPATSPAASPPAGGNTSVPTLSGISFSIARGCPNELFPVCGSDNNTYANNCTAEARGISAYSLGPCGPVPGDLVACATVYQPVCGDNNTTYPNACEARLAGASTIDSGPCGSAGSEGNITATPICTMEAIEPVCGSDNTTYNSSCWARAVGITDFTAGPCSLNLTAAGCSSGTEPVCGPGNMTYNTSCIARQQGISNYTQGACTGTSAAYQIHALVAQILLALVVTLGLLGLHPEQL